MKSISAHVPSLMSPMFAGIMLMCALMPGSALSSPQITAMALVSLLMAIVLFDGAVIAAMKEGDHASTFRTGAVLGASIGFFMAQRMSADRIGNADLMAGADRILAMSFLLSLGLVVFRVTRRQRK